MFPHASTGTEPNNDDFSDCSRTMMAGIIRDKGGCFTGMCTDDVTIAKMILLLIQRVMVQYVVMV